jgi:gluconate 2-dehydrogenase gamma chain
MIKGSTKVGRRSLLLGGAATGAVCTAAAAIHDGELGAPPRDYVGSLPWREGAADSPPEVTGAEFNFFTVDERTFIEAVVDRLIPPDEVGPGGVEANVPFFLDRQLAGAFGRGDHYYLGGPWKEGIPQQGYQLRFSPAQLYRAAIKAIDAYASDNFSGRAFARLSDAEKETVLKGLESGSLKLDGGIDGKTFFAMILQNTKEGYFADPIYGGNKDMGAWKMIGFPGAHYDYSAWVDRHGERVPYPPVSFKGRPGWRGEA